MKQGILALAAEVPAGWDTRHADIRRLDWRAAWLTDRLSEVTAAKAKMASRRLVPILLLTHAPLW
jgi:hypothetical protein